MSYAFFKNKEMSVDWTVPSEPVPEHGDLAQQPAVSVQSREPTPSPSRPQPAAQPPRIPEVVNLIDSAPTSPARQQQPPKNPQVVDLTYSPPTSPARISDRQQERDSKKPRLSTPDHTHDQPSSSSQDSTSVQGDAERNQAPSPDTPIVISDVENPQTSNEVHAPQDNPDEIMSDDEQSPPSKVVDEMETDDEQSLILSFKTPTTVVDAMETNDEPSTEKNDEEDENEEEVNDEEDAVNEEEDEDEEAEEDKQPLQSTVDWLDAEMAAHAKAEKERMRAEKYEHTRPTAKEWIEDWEEDQQDAMEKTLYISTLLRQLKIYSTE
jgi:hypothetical protein